MDKVPHGASKCTLPIIINCHGITSVNASTIRNRTVRPILVDGPGTTKTRETPPTQNKRKLGARLREIPVREVQDVIHPDKEG